VPWRSGWRVGAIARPRHPVECGIGATLLELLGGTAARLSAHGFASSWSGSLDRRCRPAGLGARRSLSRRVGVAHALVNSPRELNLVR
jgi:hypothetical protein